MGPFDGAAQVFRDGWLAVAIYRNAIDDGRVFYDSVIYRRVQQGRAPKWIRGANLKRDDIRQLIPLLTQADTWIARFS